MSTLYTNLVLKKLQSYASKERAKINAYFFKTGKGEYGEGDIFLGVTVPNVRKAVKEYLKDLTSKDLEILLQSKYHEMRLASAIAYVELYKLAEIKTKTSLFKSYIKNAKRFNNWDLVDVSASLVVGDYISNHMAHDARLSLINKFIASNNLWENRIIVVATYYQIKKKNEKMCFYVVREMMNRYPSNMHDLMQKACGWMLREVGKHCGRKVLSAFLDEHAPHMPRTMLRYSLEHYVGAKKAGYMAAKRLA